MKSTQLLSAVFSLIMFTGVTAGNTAFADSDELDNILEDFCEMTLDERTDILSKYDLDEYAEKLASVCDMDDDVRDEALDEVIDAINLETRDETDKRQLLADHPRLAPFNDRLANYCEMSEDEQDVIDELIEEHGDKIRTDLRDYAKDSRIDYKKDMRMMLDKYCDMTDADKRAFVAEHNKAEDHVDKMNRYCVLTDEDSRMDFIEEHKDEYMNHMKDKMSTHMDYERFCNLTDEELAASTFDTEFVEKASEWCDMTPEEKEAFKMEHHDQMGVPREFDGMSDVAKDKLKMKLSDKSDRLKAMIMDKRDISDERRDEIKQKFIEKHGDLTDKKKSDLKMKFKEHIKHMKVKISDERKSEIHDRLAEMKAYKAELRKNSSDMTDEEKQDLREEFIEKAKDLQLAWITPRTQIAAGIDAAEVECREGYSLVMKASNGVPICLKADTALKMIDRGIVVPAN